LGKERVEQGAYAFKTLCSSASVGENIESGNGTARNTPIMCAFASDWPVVPLNPALTLRAVSVQSREESISPEEAFLGITSSAAFVGHRENEVGSIAPGLLADFVVFNSDIMDGTLGHADVRQTFIDGVCVYGCQEEGEAVVGGGDGDFFKDEL
jgi:imidazolonepropionase-like amidohydrolase